MRGRVVVKARRAAAAIGEAVARASIFVPRVSVGGVNWVCARGWTAAGWGV